MIEKLTSRKFLCALVGLLTGLALSFGLESSTVSTLAGAVVSAVSVVSYVICEGRLDAAALESAAKSLAAALEDGNE